MDIHLLGLQRLSKFKIIIIYFLFSILFTYPLILKINTHIPGKGKIDPYIFYWNTWNFKTALLQHPHDPLIAPYLMYPFQPSLVFHTYTIVRDIVVFFSSYLIKPVLGFNLLTLLMFTFSGYGAYLLTLRFVKNKYIALVSGIIFSFCPFKLARLGGHYNFTDSAFIPFFVYFTYDLFHKINIKKSIFAGLFLALIGYCSYYYLVYSVIWVGLFLIFFIVVGDNSSGRKTTFLDKMFNNVRIFLKKRILINFLILVLVFLILFGPILLNVIRFNKEYVPSSYPNLENYPSVIDLIKPSGVSIINKYIFKQGFNLARTVSVGIVVWLLIFISIFRPRKDKNYYFWLSVGVIFTILTLGPYLKLDNKELFPLPFYLLRYVPLLKTAVQPGRFIIYAMLSFGIISAFSLEYILNKSKFKNKKRKIILLWVIMALIVAEYMTIPISLHSLKPLEYVKKIAQDQERCTVLEIPFRIAGKRRILGTGFKNLGPPQYFQSIHNKLLLSGTICYIPQKIIDYYKKIDFVHTLCQLQNKNINKKKKNETLIKSPTPYVDNFFDLYNIKYIVIHKKELDNYSLNLIRKYLFRGISRLTLLQENKELIFLLRDKSSKNSFIDKNLMSPEYEMCLTEGWSNYFSSLSGRTIVAKKTSIVFPAEKGQKYYLLIKYVLSNGMNDLHMKIIVNNYLIDEISHISSMKYFSRKIEIPPRVVLPGPNLLEFRFNKLNSPGRGIKFTSLRILNE